VCSGYERPIGSNVERCALGAARDTAALFAAAAVGLVARCAVLRGTVRNRAVLCRAERAVPPLRAMLSLLCGAMSCRLISDLCSALLRHLRCLSCVLTFIAACL
jgi:hypothetical protein